MHVLVRLHSLLHLLVDIVDVSGHVLAHRSIKCLLILLVLALLLIQQDPRLFEVFIEVEANLLFQALLEEEDVVLHQTQLPGGHVQLVDEIVATREDLRVDDLIQLFFCMLQFVLQVQQLHILGVEEVLILEHQHGKLLTSSTHFNLTALHDVAAQVIHALVQVLGADGEARSGG